MFVRVDQPAVLQEVPDMLDSIIVFWICGANEMVERGVAFGS